MVALIGGSLHRVIHWPAVGSHDMSFGVGFRGHHHTRVSDTFSLADWGPSLPLVTLSLAVAAAVYWMARMRDASDATIAGSGRQS